MSRRAGEAARLRGGAPVFAARGDATRLAIVARLCRIGPASIAGLTEGSGVISEQWSAALERLRALVEE